MRKLVFSLLVLLGGATSALQGQNENSLGIRLTSFNPRLSTTISEDDTRSDFAGGLGLHLVRDWAREGQAFLRGRLALDVQTSRNPLGSKSFTSGNHIATGLSFGRGRRIDLAPFAFSYGVEVGLGFTPYSRLKAQYVGSNSQGDYAEVATTSQIDASVGAGVFLQLDWNIHRNVWIGIEQRFIASLNYSKANREITYSITPTGGGTTTTTVDNETSNEVSFSHPFNLAFPLFSITFRPGGK